MVWVHDLNSAVDREKDPPWHLPVYKWLRPLGSVHPQIYIQFSFTMHLSTISVLLSVALADAAPFAAASHNTDKVSPNIHDTPQCNL